MEEDKRIIKKYLEGDETAFEELVNKYSGSVYNFLLQLTSDAELASDGTSETFFKVWRKIRSLKNRDSFKPWVFRLAKNTAFDLLKKKRPVAFSALGQGEEDGNHFVQKIKDKKTESPLDRTVRREWRSTLDRAIRRLPADYRTVIFLYFKEELSLLEIASVLNKPYNTVKSSLRRALLALKKEIGQKETEK